GNETDDYRRWTRGFAPKLYTAALVVYGIGGLLYAGSWEAGLRDYMTAGAALPFAALAATGPAIPLVLLWLGRNAAKAGLWVILAQFLVLGLHAIARQLAQNFRLAPFLDLASDPV